MTEKTTSNGKIKRTVKDKLYFIVFGKYPEQNDEEVEVEVEEIEETEKKDSKKDESYFDKAKSFFKKKSKEKLKEVKKNAKKVVSEKSGKKEIKEIKEKTEDEEKREKRKEKVVKKVDEIKKEVKKEKKLEENKESAFDSLKGLAMEEVDSVKTFSETRTKNLDKQDEINQKNQEKLFKEKTKMTLLQAEKKVKKWNENGETKKVKAGVKLILEYFPNHEFRKINLSKNKTKKTDELVMDKKGEVTKKHTKKVKSLFTKIASNPSHGFDVSPEFLEQNGLPQEADVNDDERVFGALSYFPLLSLFVLATRKDSAFAMYHAWQGFAILAIFLVSLPFYWILTLIPGVGILFFLFYMGLFIVSMYAGFLAWSGRYINIPVISNFGMKLAGK